MSIQNILRSIRDKEDQDISIKKPRSYSKGGASPTSDVISRIETDKGVFRSTEALGDWAWSDGTYRVHWGGILLKQIYCVSKHDKCICDEVATGRILHAARSHQWSKVLEGERRDREKVARSRMHGVG